MSTSYDSVVYPSYPYHTTAPDWLAAIGHFFGLQAPAPANARVLELGCASGGNLLPLAEAYPNARFVGVDLSSKQIELGQQQIQDLGITNLELRAADLTVLVDESETFDYILCHGVYSWIPDEVRTAILEICRKKLTPNGIASISYNTYPGWHMRGMLREIMCFHAARFETPETQVKQSRALLEFLSSSLTSQTDPYAILLRRETDILRNTSDSYLYHEHLEEHNDPCYFFEFVGTAKQHQLQYLGDASFPTMFVQGLPPQVQQTLVPLAPDLIQLEQYMDFIRNRTFRSSLICLSSATLLRQIRPEIVNGLHLSTTAKPAPLTTPNPSPQMREYKTMTGINVNTDNPIFIAMLEELIGVSPGSILFTELEKRVTKRLTQQYVLPEQELAKVVLRAMIGGIVDFSVTASRAHSIISQKPKISPLMRYQAQTQDWCVNLKHQTIKLDDLAKVIMPLLDGTRTQDDVVKKVMEPIVAGKNQLRIKGEVITNLEQAWKECAKVVHEKLEYLRNCACLLA